MSVSNTGMLLLSDQGYQELHKTDPAVDGWTVAAQTNTAPAEKWSVIKTFVDQL
jgi:hypothetical protein